MSRQGDEQRTAAEVGWAIPVPLYISNILCYARMVLALYGLAISSSGRPVETVVVFVVASLLDLVDGPLARALGQTSSLGILLDIAADNILRTCGWMAAVMSSCNTSDDAAGSSSTPLLPTIAAFIICVEWITMLSTQLHATHSEQHWKSEREHDPWLVRALFANNFRNPIGIVVIYGLFSSSLWAYGSHHPQIYDNIPLFDICKYLAYCGRALGLAVELWMIKGYLALVILKDSIKKSD